MLLESDIIPYHVSPPPGERVIILAPHPDDETLGCGGTIRLLLEAKKNVKVIFLTRGEKADPSAVNISAYALLREKEARKALRVLGVTEYDFLRFPDRELYARSEEVREGLLQIMAAYRMDTLYSPSMVELNPDHRAAAAISLAIQRTWMGSAAPGERTAPVKVVFFEVTTPLRPNLLVDVTNDAYRRKIRAAKKYGSQLKLMNYLKHITALNAIRCLTVKGSHRVEAFWSIERPLGDEEISAWLSYQESSAGTW